MKEDLDFLIYHYYDEKQVLDAEKKVVDEYNQKIKTIMEEQNIDEYITKDNVFVAKKTIQNRESFIEPALINKLKQLGVTTPIKTVEVIDYDELENVIYTGIVDASALAEFKETKQVVTLKVSKNKKKGNE